MSNTKIVIDKEQILERIKSSKKLDTPFAQIITTELEWLLQQATEIQIDQSIEERATKYAIVKFGHRDEDTESGFEEGSIQQQIIGQLSTTSKELKCTRCGSKKLTLCSVDEFACDECGEFPITI